MTDSTLYLNKIDAVKTSLASQNTQNELIITALDMARDILTNGYSTDQARIDSAIQTDSDSRSQQIADLTTAKETAEQTILTMTETHAQELQAKQDEIDVLTSQNIELTRRNEYLLSI